MLKTLKNILWCALGLILALGLLSYLAFLSSTPLLTSTIEATTHPDTVTHILRKQQRELRFGHPVITITDDEINALINHALQRSQFKQRANAVVALDDDHGHLQATLDTQLPLTPFLNISLDFQVKGRQLIIDTLHIGQISLPATLSNHGLSLIEKGLLQTRAGATWQRLFDAVEHIDINDNEVSVHYGLDYAKPPQLIDSAGNNLLELYQQALTAHFPQGGKIPLAQALKHLFALANQRSRNGANPSLENTAALVTLSRHVAPENLLELFGIPPKDLTNLSFSIERQRDLGKHFLTSAFLTVYGGKQLANLAGTYKELVDLQLRKDFDIRDLIANQAGIRFAQAAINPELAQPLQELMTKADDEHYVVPRTLSFNQDTKELLQQAAVNQDANLQKTVRRKVGEYVERAPLYQDLASLKRQKSL